MEACTCAQSTCMACKSMSIAENSHSNNNNNNNNNSSSNSCNLIDTNYQKRNSLPLSNSLSSSLSELTTNTVNTNAMLNNKADAETTRMHVLESSSHKTYNTLLNNNSSNNDKNDKQRVALGEVCGYTADGVASYSNGSHNTWLNEKHHVNNLFMGYKWQCVEFARRWLWQTQHLLLPQRNCACGFTNLKYVYKPIINAHEATIHTSRIMLELEENSEQSSSSSSSALSSTSPSQEQTNSNNNNNIDSNVYANNASNSCDSFAFVNGRSSVKWAKVPCKFIKQGSSTAPPRPRSLIIYPRSWHSPWGHIGVITHVDVTHNIVCVADQNRFFHPWNNRTYSAIFALRTDSHNRYYIDDFEGYKCSGWVEIDGVS